MSWFQSLRDDFSLRPFELQRTHSDSGSMASGPPDVMTNQEPAEVAEECSGKKKSKFQTFKKFFTRKKRKEPPAAAAAAAADAGLKASQSSDNVSKTSDNNTLTRSEKEKGSGSKISLGSKALSHDSVFVSDSSEANEALGASQDSIHGKVKSLQLQLKQAIKLGSPPSLMCVKRTEDAGTMSEDDGLPCSPPEYTTLHTAMNQVERNSSVSLEGLDSDDDQLSCAAPSRAMSPLVVPGDFSQPASPFGCLDNSAAKHKLGLRHKACNKRKPVARLELKVEEDSMTLNTSVTEALEEKDQQKTTTEAADEPTPKVEVEEEEKKVEEEEEEESQHATQSLLRDKEQREEGEDEPEAGQDVSQGLDTSCPTEPCPSEEEVPDVQPPSSRASSGASSLDSPRNTPEPPAGQREHLLEPPAVARDEEEDAAEGDLPEEDGVQEESSFLQEVLSSLKTPLAPSPSAGEAEAGDLEVEEGEDVEAEEEEEEKEEEEAEVEEPVSNQVLPADSFPSDQTTKEEEEVSAFSSTCQDDEEEEEHKVEDKEEEAAAEEEEEEEELTVEQICPHSENEEEEKGEEEEVTTEHQNDLLTENPVIQEEGGGDEESEAEEEEAEVEKQEEEVEEAEEAEEAAEALVDVAEEMMQPKAAAEDVDVTVTVQDEGDEGDEGDEDDALNTPESRDDGEIPAELHDQVMESQVASSASCEEQEEEEERMEEDEDQREHKPDQEEDDGANQPDEDQTEPDVEREAAEESHSDMEQVEKDPLETTEEAPVPAKPSPLSLPESHDEAQPLESAPITPSKTSTTTLHINLVSPSSEKVTSFFQHSQNVEHPEDSGTLSAAEEATEQNTTSAGEEEEAGTVEAVEEEKQLVPEDEEEKETPSPASVEEPVDQSSSGSAQSKVRFTVAPAWQRSLSAEDAKDTATPPSSPPASSVSSVSSPSSAIAGPGDEESEEPASSAEGEQVSDRVGNTKAAAAKPQRSPASPPSPVKTPTSASTEESSVIVEGNPDNPFGVRLRKTSGLYRFSSEEENAEPHMEPPAQSSSSKVDSPQPVSVKPSFTQPASAKPALPKKPDVHGDGAGKSRRISDPAAGRGVSAGSDSPSWISVAKQKQKIYKENSLEEIAVKKEEQERKSSLPMYVSSAVSREHGGKTAESTGKVSLVESSKSSVSAEKEPRRSLSPPTPVPAQTPKSQSFPSPVPPKPQPPPATSKPPPHKSMSPPTPVPVPQKPPSCTSPPPPSKPAASANTPQPQSATVTSPPFSPRTTSEKPVLRAPGLSSQTPSSQRGGPPPALPQDEPPWMALAKKKAKAWSEMPQIAPV